jgi:hypothetical protein
MNGTKIVSLLRRGESRLLAALMMATAAMTAFVLSGCSSCGQGSSRASEASDDAAPRYMATEPDASKRFRIRGPAVRAVIDGGGP